MKIYFITGTSNMDASFSDWENSNERYYFTSEEDAELFIKENGIYQSFKTLKETSYRHIQLENQQRRIAEYAINALDFEPECAFFYCGTIFKDDRKEVYNRIYGNTRAEVEQKFKEEYIDKSWGHHPNRDATTFWCRYTIQIYPINARRDCK